MRLFEKFRKTFASCVIVAAGSSERMSGIDKLFAPLGGKPVLAYSLEACEACPDVSEIIVVTREDKIAEAMELCDKYAPGKTASVVCGGATRAESALEGALAASKEAAVIAVHDGARPLVTPALISRVIRLAKQKGAAVPTVPVTDTIKKVEKGVVASTPRRDSLFAAQTPQAFDAALIKAALTESVKKGVTDDSQAVEMLGMKVSVAEGDPDNFKLTLPRDFAAAEDVIARRASK